MRISTSSFSVKVCLGSAWDQCAQLCPYAHLFDQANVLAWTWILSENKELHLPKSFTSQLKANPGKMLQVGLDKGYYTLKLSIKPEKGRVWTSVELRPSKFPEEIIKQFSEKNAAKKTGSSQKWYGEIIEIFTPMHQKHPGLTEHALLGAVELNGNLMCFISDSANPEWATYWHVFELICEKGVAISRMETIERAKQREFEATYPGESFEMRDGLGKKLSMDELLGKLGGVRKFAWTVNADAQIEIPAQTRKFKLGECITESERKAMPIEEVMKMLAAACK